MLIKFSTINKLLILALSYIQLININTLEILLLLFQDTLLKLKRKSCL